MSKKGKIEIILNEEGAEIRMKRGTADWGEVIDALACASAGAIIELVNPDKIQDALAMFCTHVVLAAKERSESLHVLKRE